MSSEMMEKLADQAKLLKPGAFLAVTTNRLEGQWLETLEVGRLRQGWGSARVFIQRRLADDVADPRAGLTIAEAETAAADASGGSEDGDVSESDEEGSDADEATKPLAPQEASTGGEGPESGQEVAKEDSGGFFAFWR
eukprot:FR735848.1.p1 GENE.FR735848.1~~FR735848.1.p1  ORF type:complete len:138 (-),score=26.41 FR735848.1:36-449(-)